MHNDCKFLSGILIRVTDDEWKRSIFTVNVRITMGRPSEQLDSQIG